MDTDLTNMALKAIDNNQYERAAALAAVAQAKETAAVAHWLADIAASLRDADGNGIGDAVNLIAYHVHDHAAGNAAALAVIARNTGATE